MRDLLDILAAYESLPYTEPATLATVVRVEGSAYRLPGARMLIDAAGRRVGSVSGGCLEADVARRGRLLSDDSPGILVRYDGADDAETAWNYALGCDGAIEVFIERLPPRGDGRSALDGRGSDLQTPSGALSLEFLSRCMHERAAGVLVTVFSAPIGAAVAVGTRLTLQADCEPFGVACIADAPLRAAILADAQWVLANAQTTTVTYRTAAGPMSVLVESVRPPLALMVWGAGHDALPLVDAGKALGWHVTVADRRAGYARPERFPAADVVRAVDLASGEELPIPAGAAVVIMTHHYPDDRALLAMALRSPAGYIGVLGPRVRSQRMLAELAAEGLNPTAQQLARLHAPMGLDVGAEGAGPVALSIVAEILAATHDRPGTPLRQREGPIHTPPLSRVVSAVGGNEMGAADPLQRVGLNGPRRLGPTR